MPFQSPSPRTHSRRLGFTLVELMVVIGILAILISILVPVISKARWQARITTCSANLRNMAIACVSYARANHGEFPSMPMPGTGANTWDVALGFYDALRKEGMPHLSVFCPASDDYDTSQASFDTYTTFKILSYNVWIQRKNGADVIPPPHTTTSSRFTLPTPKPTKPFAGPARMGDTDLAENPIITDIVGTSGTPPADAKLTDPSDPYGISGMTNHKRGKVLVSINAAYSDGHVETIPGEQVRPRYKGNWWNWR